MALPFIMGDTTISEYLLRSRFAGGGRNGIGQADEKFDNVAAHKDHTIFWYWLPESQYYSKEWNDYLKLSILIANVYNFFIRR